MFRFTACIVAAVLAVAAAAAPSKPLWPWQFDSDFGLNVRAAGYVNVSSKFYYNWNLQASRIEYHHGCLPQITRKSCDLIFNPKGTYLLAPEAGKPCCMLFPGIGSVPPNFLGPFNYSNQAIVPDFYGQKHVTNHWVAIDGFAYWTDVTTGSDIQFHDGGSSIAWNFGPLNTRAQPRSLFALPDADKCSAPCNAGNIAPKDVFPLLR